MRCEKPHPRSWVLQLRCLGPLGLEELLLLMVLAGVMGPKLAPYQGHSTCLDTEELACLVHRQAHSLVLELHCPVLALAAMLLELRQALIHRGPVVHRG